MDDLSSGSFAGCKLLKIHSYVYRVYNNNYNNDREIFHKFYAKKVTICCCCWLLFMVVVFDSKMPISRKTFHKKIKRTSNLIGKNLLLSLSYVSIYFLNWPFHHFLHKKKINFFFH